MDYLSTEARSRLMAKIAGKDTKPEKLVRSLLYEMGFRFRLHRSDLPGTPDIVLPKYFSIIFVHGCFWHQHDGCKRATMPKTNVEFWRKKLQDNRTRDLRNIEQLEAIGYRCLVIWECETKNLEQLADRLTTFLTRKGGTCGKTIKYIRS